MYVCLCRGVSSRTIRRCAEEGARTVEDVGQRCGAGTVCGTCRVDIDGLLRDARAARRDRPSEGEHLAAK